MWTLEPGEGRPRRPRKPGESPEPVSSAPTFGTTLSFAIPGLGRSNSS